jgi:transcriptional regulator with XRE-family HTH domain
MTAATAFPQLCRQWRQLRRLSQLDLAERAEVSQRHLSWLETGRSKPSRGMVLRIAEALEIPLRERNKLLHAAGFAPHYRESALTEAAMAPVRDALARVLAHHEPFPALVVDRKWNRVMGNAASDLMLSLAGAKSATDDEAIPVNLAAATLAPNGLRRYIRNADVALPMFVQRLRAEAQASGQAETIAYVEALIRAAGDLPCPRESAAPLLPVLPLELDIDGLRLSLFSVMSTFGTPQDITADELRIEAFYPMDDTTRAFFESGRRS